MSGQNQQVPYYFVPNPSRHPLTASLGLLVMMGSLAAWLNGASWAPLTFAAGLLFLFWVLYHWFGDAIFESEVGQYGKRVDKSYRWSMSWFIFSEVMFFLAFFGALFYARHFATDTFANLENKLLWPDFAAVWPNNGPADLVAQFRSMTPWPLPTINTALLLTSGVTLTVSHHALRDNHRRKAIIWLAATVLLGLIFLFCQGYEYFHAYHELNLRLTSGAYGSTFFLLTGFHGFHVTLGALMLFVVMIRLIRGHFTADHHFAFEGAAWYWHFVDVVWLGLYVVVYWL
ncbi:cytochrome c oxidase subunit 3 [Chitinasiproducens palmae]|uniref:cytochrome-c oxidase n=1 Tax=Chitinasiproducens palmae TaxID=1770053 RepID=A0A1H2PPL5_9BURK|nr:cytochrome c oxidase subunit 3 [Chitinasiproducens palmae]SDV48239.1 cytochrome c oxidase subunit 3 [Chitinasiproducens palmae]